MVRYVTLEDNISVLPLSVRSLNCLNSVNISSVKEMLSYPIDGYAKIRNMGRKSVKEIETLIGLLIGGSGEYVIVGDYSGIENIKVLQEKIIKKGDIDEDGEVTIFVDEQGVIIRDVLVKDLPLSIRARNSIMKAGIEYASQMIGITDEELLGFQNMGFKTVKEVRAYINKIHISYDLEPKDNVISNLVLEMQNAYGENGSLWLKEILEVKKQYPQAIGENLIYYLYDRKIIRKHIKEKIISLIECNKNGISKSAIKKYLPQHLENTTIIEKHLIELEYASEISIDDGMVYRKYPSVSDFVSRIDEERIKMIIKLKLEGKTLNDIGEQYGLTRERIRQIIKKLLRSKPYLEEDRYTYIYNSYDWSLEDFLLASDEPIETYYYLEMVSSTPKMDKKPLEEILEDNSVSVEFRKKAERAIYKKYVFVDGVYVKKDRQLMVKHFVKINCRNLIKYNDFFKQYNSWIDNLGIDCSLKIEARSYENFLNQCDFALWSQGRSFRYYNITEKDFSELLSTIDLEQYKNTELSTLKLFRDYSDLMQQYDIADEYELHNLLKKIWSDERGDVKFKKMPTIEIGKANRKEQLISLLLQYAPIDIEELANKYEEEYGVKAGTVRGSYLRDIEQYLCNRRYSIDYAALSEIQFDRMKNVLTNDFYVIEDVKNIYKREFPESDESLINPYTLKTLGFHVYSGYSGYIIKKTFSSATDYFNYILTNDDVIDIRKYNAVIRCIATFCQECYRLRSLYEIVEFLPLQYVNIRRLNEVGFNKTDLYEYCICVAEEYEKGEYFTISSIREKGFTHKLDELGFDEWFYSSILMEDHERFSFQRIGNTRIFLRGEPDCNMGKMFTWLLEKYQRIDLYDFIEIINDYYGIALAKERIIEIIDSTELYYDRIMEAIYIDYDTYFEEI